MRRDVFQAIADPNRRAIVDLLAAQSLSVNEVAARFDISRPAISKHVKILTECGLIIMRQQGRERYCDVQLNKLQEVVDWTEQYRQFWNKKLDALGDFLSADPSKSNATNSSSSKTKNA